MAFGPPRAPDDGSASSGQPLDSAIVRATSPALSPATTTVGSSSTHHRGRDGVGDTGVSLTAPALALAASALTGAASRDRGTRVGNGRAGHAPSSGTSGSRYARLTCTATGAPGPVHVNPAYREPPARAEGARP